MSVEKYQNVSKLYCGIVKDLQPELYDAQRETSAFGIPERRANYTKSMSP